VRPFYLEMAGEAAPTNDIQYRALAKVVDLTSDDDVECLLASHWRPRVMGAWLSAGRNSERITNALVQSLETSQGLLTSPPLATVAVLNIGEAAIPALRAYLAAHIKNDWGNPGFIVAAIEHVGGSVDGLCASDDDRSGLAAMLSVARRLRSLASTG
jgi:hypothetical protein